MAFVSADVRTKWRRDLVGADRGPPQRLAARARQGHGPNGCRPVRVQRRVQQFDRGDAGGQGNQGATGHLDGGGGGGSDAGRPLLRMRKRTLTQGGASG